MGKKMKEARKFNKKARKSSEIVIDQSEANKIRLDLEGVDATKFDEANQLVLPSKKRKTKIKKLPAEKSEKILSRKQRKKLEKIVERREKKSNRAELIEELQKYQLPSAAYDTLTPLVRVQTEGLRNINLDSLTEETKPKVSGSGRSGWKKSGAIVANKQKFLSWSRRFSGKSSLNSNSKVLGFEESSDEDTSEEDEEEELEDAVEQVETGEEVNGSQQQGSCEDSQDNVDASDSVDLINTDQQVTTEDTEMPAENGNKKRKDKRKRKAMDSDEKSPEKRLVTVPVSLPSSKPKKVIHVTRSDEITTVRSKLPIIPEEQVIMEQITENLAVVLAGETGCGKTTQVPQFLYEAGYATDGKIIGVTEPRRVAAISMAARVGHELSLTSEEVSFQIRFEGTASAKTLIKFMTDGVLLKEMGKDFLLKKYSVICIDEAHERSLFTDILIGLLSRCVVARAKRGDPLKLVVMSATMRVSDFLENSKLFKTKPGFVHVPARQFPVQIHFTKTTPPNYVQAAIKKVVQIHKKLPPGGILVFLTGQQEVLAVVKQLRKICPNPEDDSEAPSPASFKGRMKKPLLKSVNLDEVNPFPKEAEHESNSEDSEDEEEDLSADIETSGLEPMHILPLYSMLPIAEQKMVFEPPPDGRRLCVVTTNVAETSLTIPSIRYVVDSGKVKEKLWDKVTGVETFKIMWCSKASAEQRSGRAGRVGPGHCYRLFSSAVFEHDFPEFSTPEIKARPVDDMVLLMKSMAIDNVKNFPYPTHPGEEQLTVAENLLVHLGALERKSGKITARGKMEEPAVITPLGVTMSQFPVGPRFGKMLAVSFNHNLTDYVVLLSSAFTVQEPLLDGGAEKEVQDKWLAIRRKWAGVGSSFLLGDAMVLIKAVEAFENDGGSAEFSYKMGLRFKAMIEIRKLRKQLTNNINVLLSTDKEIPLNPKLSRPSEGQCTLLRQIILSGCPDRIARRVEPEEATGSESQAKLRNAYKCGELEDVAYLHQSSVMRKSRPQWITYQEAFEIEGKIYLRGVVAIEPDWIVNLCPSMCHLDKPMKDPPPFYDQESGLVKCYVKATYGRQGWELPVTTIEHPKSAEKYRLFAQFLLDGEIFDKLLKWRPHLLLLPNTMTKSWAKLQPRTQSLLQRLVASQVDSRESILDAWAKDKRLLLDEYLEWVPERLHADVRSSWPPL